MRRTSICLAIFALLLGMPARGQESLPLPLGQAVPSSDPTPTPYDQIPTPQTDPRLTPQTDPGLETQPDPNTGVSETAWGRSQGYIDPADPAAQETEGLGPCCERTGEGYCCPKEWYVDQRARAINHPRPSGVPLGRRGGIVNLFWDGSQFVTGFRKSTVLSTRNAADFEPAGGYEVTIGHYLGRDEDNRNQFIEFTYYGMHSWEGSAESVSNSTIASTNGDDYPNSSQIPSGYTLVYGNLFSAFDNGVAGFNRAEQQDMTYKSKFDNFELNLRIEPRQRRDRLILEPNGRWRREGQDNCQISWLGGIRVISLDESFRFNSSGQVSLYQTSSGTLYDQTDVSGLYDVRTRNDLVGLQIGGEFTKRRGLATYGMRTKGGVFINFADQEGHIKTTGSDGDYAATIDDIDLYGTDHSHGAAGLIEFGGIASYRLRDHIIVHAAYDLMWVAGLALAPEQIRAEAIAPNRIDSGGVQMFQSASLGVEITW